jgi:hydroxyacylglutathione hydrolase
VNHLQLQHDGAPYAIEQFVAQELGNSSYVVADLASGEALVIDPVRDADEYVAFARGRGWKLTYAIDTHVHNDFLSGGAELAAAGCGEYLQPWREGGSGATAIGPDHELALGSLRLRAVHTPGHTPEHLSYLLLDSGDRPQALFSGGALMVGTIARPDLLGAHRTFAFAQMAFETVRDVLTPMQDSVAVLPTHGQGSFCGGAQSGDRTTSIGRERRENALFGNAGFFDFLAAYANQGEYPDYYRHMAPQNLHGVPLLGLPLQPLRRISCESVDELRSTGVWLVDIRANEAFDGGFVPGSLSAGIEGPMSAWLGWVMPSGQGVALIADAQESANQARRMLTRVGIDAVEGWLSYADWAGSGRPVARMRRGDMRDLARSIGGGEGLAVIDVRQEREWVSGHIPGALHAMPAQVRDAVDRIPPSSVVAVHCSSGYRSALAASLLARDTRVTPWHIVDGVDQWRELGHPVAFPR